MKDVVESGRYLRGEEGSYQPVSKTWVAIWLLGIAALGLEAYNRTTKPREPQSPQTQEVFVADNPATIKCQDENRLLLVDLRRDERGRPTEAVVNCKPTKPAK